MLTDRTFGELFSDVDVEAFEPRTNPRAVVASAASAALTGDPRAGTAALRADASGAETDAAPTSSQRSSA